jgi:hypothetical protein
VLDIRISRIGDSVRILKMHLFRGKRDVEVKVTEQECLGLGML